MKKKLIKTNIENILKKYESSSVNKKYWYPLSVPTYDNKEIYSVIDSLLDFQTTMSKKTIKFENKFSNYTGSKYSIMVNSGSSADLLLANSLQDKINLGDEILVPCVTWPTHIWSIIQSGFTPKLVDINKQTLNICYDDLESKITPKTKALFVVHLMGNPCNMDILNKICKKNKLLLIEDCCEALGSKWDNKHVGNFGIGGSFSFFFSHHLTTMEGGMVITQSDLLMNKFRILRSHGWARDIKNIPKEYKNIDPRYLFVDLGYNFRPTELQAAFGLEQLKKIKKFNNSRNSLANFFFEEIKKYDLIYAPKVELKAKPSWFALPIIIKRNKFFKKNDLTNYLEKNGIECRPIVVGDISKQPIKNKYPKIFKQNFPNANYIHNNGFYIGLSPLSNLEIIKRVIFFINKFMSLYNL